MISPGLYAQWRARSWAAQTLAERPEGAPLTEQLLQLIWQYQRLRREELRSGDGHSIRVLHPGFWNHAAGPDFQSAVIQFDEEAPRSGDIEVDLSPSGWHAHGHDHNPAFAKVILHVVWDGDATAAPVPTLPLSSRLDSPLDELALWLRKEPLPAPAALFGRCSAPLAHLAPEDILRLLRQAAQARLQSKAGQFQARARQVGWERSLWEGLFSALGYRNNIWPMRRISELLPILKPHDSPTLSPLILQARLLGVSGLLPSDLERTPASAKAYLHKVWNLWWREREQFAEFTLPRSLWRLSGLRPANNPQRRLALAAHWLTRSDLPLKLEHWFASLRPDSRMPSSLLQVLETEDDEFWSNHWSFRSRRMKEKQPLIGPQRVTDLAINVVLPWFWIRAGLGQNGSLQAVAEECYFAWPKAEDNAVLRLARRRLFGTSHEPVLGAAALQQGLLQIVRDFCDYSNALCENCIFPSHVQAQLSFA